MNCAHPSCGGEIDEDGYCDVCGRAPRDDPATAVIPAPAALSHEPGSHERSGRASSSPAPSTSSTTTPTTKSTARHKLGRGLISMPAVSVVAPEAAVLVDPQVPERNRFCPNPACKKPVGRSRDGGPGRAEGHCSQCGTRFNFLPRLAAGDVVAGQYRVLGCLGRGGMGWVYLAWDDNVGFYVALKGVLHAGDESANAAAAAELRLLAEIKHPNIVRIYNFVKHDDAEYIVMEFVNGVSLQTMLDRRREANGGDPSPIPVGEAIVYCLELLPALEYLHERGFAFCDFKPDNAIRTDDAVKLIDLGGGYRMGSDAPDIFGTPGYQAPEIARTGPTVASDLFTVGRTLAMLTTDFAGYRREYEYSLPPAHDHAVYTRFDSLYRFLERATAFDPVDRFQSAIEMAGQLEGVLCEVAVSLAAERNEARLAPRTSLVFTPQARGANDRPDVNRLPTPIVDPEDRHAGTILALAAAAPADIVKHVDNVVEPSIELDLWQVRALVGLNRLDEAQDVLAAVEANTSGEWRVDWYRGIVAMADDRGQDAFGHFDTVYRWLPGELAPKLALAMAAEMAGEHSTAIRWYEIVAHTDDAYTSAALGLGRCHQQIGAVRSAIAAYRRVPESSSAYTHARIAEIELLLHGDDAPTTLDDAVEAATIIAETSLERQHSAQLRADVMETLLAWVGRTQHPVPDSVTVFGRAIAEPDLRLGLEATYRELARGAGSKRERVALVDRANRVRPRSWL